MTPLDQMRKELARIDESLANPIGTGREWDQRRVELERQADVFRRAIEQVERTTRIRARLSGADV